MFTYLPTPNSVPTIIYIPTGSGNNTPYDGPLWVAVLLLGGLYITLLFACYKMYVDLIKNGTGKEDKTMFAVFTLLLFSVAVIATMAFM